MVKKRRDRSGARGEPGGGTIGRSGQVCSVKRGCQSWVRPYGAISGPGAGGSAPLPENHPVPVVLSGDGGCLSVVK